MSDKQDNVDAILEERYKPLAVPLIWRTSVVKVSGFNLTRSNTFKRRLDFSFTVILLA